MIVVGQLSQFSKEFIFLCDPVTNNQQPGRFIRVLYMTPYFTLNGISLQLPLRHCTIERYFNKLKCTFSVMHHQDIIQRLHQMEVDILATQGCKTPVYRIAQQMSEGYLRIFPPNVPAAIEDLVMVVNVSGIWEDNVFCGLTYRFVARAQFSPPR
jgi:hypothetical protein